VAPGNAGAAARKQTPFRSESYACRSDNVKIRTAEHDEAQRNADPTPGSRQHSSRTVPCSVNDQVIYPQAEVESFNVAGVNYMNNSTARTTEGLKRDQAATDAKIRLLFKSVSQGDSLSISRRSPHAIERFRRAIETKQRTTRKIRSPLPPG
jgi:hypothetical protein